MSAPLTPHEALRIEAGARRAVQEVLAEESAVALLFNGEAHAVLMASPVDLEDLAIGFALSEGIVARSDELRVMEIIEGERGHSLHLAIPDANAAALATRRRSLVAGSGCGLCGLEALDAALRPIRRVAEGPPVGAAQLREAMARLPALQPLNAACGSLHAAAALLPDGSLLVREDVGRHNALDKLIGALAREGSTARAVLMSSRASFELVHKAAEAGIGLLATVSGPTALAVRLADEAGLCLVGFARDERLTVYAGAARLKD